MSLFTLNALEFEDFEMRNNIFNKNNFIKSVPSSLLKPLRKISLSNFNMNYTLAINEFSNKLIDIVLNKKEFSTSSSMLFGTNYFNESNIQNI